MHKHQLACLRRHLPLTLASLVFDERATPQNCTSEIGYGSKNAVKDEPQAQQDTSAAGSEQ